MTEASGEGFGSTLRQLDRRIADAEAELKLLVKARDALRDVVAASSHLPTVPPPAQELDASDNEEGGHARSSIVDRLTRLVESAPAGTTWRAAELAARLYDSAPSNGQVEGVRSYARRMVDKHLLVKNANGSFTKVGGEIT